MNKKKVLIVGAGGFIGSRLVKDSLEKGYEVFAGVRRSSRIYDVDESCFTRLELDLSSPDRLRSQLTDAKDRFGKWDYIIYNLGITKARGLKEFRKINVGYFDHLLHTIVALNAVPERLILLSSLSAIGAWDELGMSAATNNLPYNPTTAYGQSKCEMEQVLLRYPTIRYTVFRPTGVYGPNDRDYRTMIESIRKGFDLNMGLTDKLTTFVYVDDLVRFMLRALEVPQSAGKSYNVSDGKVYSSKDFREIAMRELGLSNVNVLYLPVPLVVFACFFGELWGQISGNISVLNWDKGRIFRQKNWICDINELVEDLGIRPEFDLDKGLTQTIRSIYPNR